MYFISPKRCCWGALHVFRRLACIACIINCWGALYSELRAIINCWGALYSILPVVDAPYSVVRAVDASYRAQRSRRTKKELEVQKNTRINISNSQKNATFQKNGVTPHDDVRMGPNLLNFYTYSCFYCSSSSTSLKFRGAWHHNSHNVYACSGSYLEWSSLFWVLFWHVEWI